MIETFKISGGLFERIDYVEKSSWINVFSPNHEELKKLKELFEIPEDMILSLQDKEEMPTIEQHNKHTFIILRTPNKNSELDYATVPLGIILWKDYFVTICFRKNDVIEKFKSHSSNFKKSHLILRFMMETARLYLHYLNEINKSISFVETKLYRSQKNSEIARLLRLEKSLVYFSTSLKSNDFLMGKISSEKNFIRLSEDKEIIDAIKDETAQAITMADVYTNILTNLMDAFASMISNNLNIAMKVLTSVTILFAIPGLLASLYGMNVELPFQHSPNAFLLVMFLSLIFSGVFLFFLWKNEMI